MVKLVKTWNTLRVKPMEFIIKPNVLTFGIAPMKTVAP